MADERHGEAFEVGEQLTVVGRKLKGGERAPDFVLDHFDGDSVSTVRLSDGKGHVRLLTTVNSLDTPVCAGGTEPARRFDSGRRDPVHGQHGSPLRPGPVAGGGYRPHAGSRPTRTTGSATTTAC